MENSYIFDIETDNLLDDVTTIHCLSYKPEGTNIKPTTLFTRKEITEFIQGASRLIGHHIIAYDLAVLEKLWGLKYEGEVVDTLPLSWYMNFWRSLHGLESYGKEFGIEKVAIDDWENLSIEDYQKRCERDVEINDRLWTELQRPLKRLYTTEADLKHCLDYQNLKMRMIAGQERLKWKLDVPKAESLLSFMEKEADQKVLDLSKAMPKQPVIRKYTPPKVMKKKDGSPTEHALTWFERLGVAKMPQSTMSEISIIEGYTDANPNSHQQVKDWLYSLGWEPCTHKFVRDKNGDRKIPQVRFEGELTESVKLLADRDKNIEILDGLSVLQHRIGVVRGFLKKVVNGYVVAGATGTTNTMRFKHAMPCVNIPGVDKPFGKEIRSLLIAPEGCVVMGADMVSLENTTKQHYILPHDPKYVEDMQQDDYDPHLDLAVFNGTITKEMMIDHIEGRADYGSIRKPFKTVNYAALYGVSALGLSRQSTLTQSEAGKLLEAFWKRNWAVERAMEDIVVRRVNQRNWCLNPVTKMWYNLRHQKDTFSTINQGTGAYLFDMWIKECIGMGATPVAQFHDEGVWVIEEDKEEYFRDILKKAITKVNNNVKEFSVDLDIDIQTGLSYAEVH